VKELEVRQATTASVSEVQAVLADLRPVPMPSLTLGWRGRSKVRMLHAQFSAETEPAPGGGSVLTCRYRFTGLFSRLIGSEGYEWMRGDLQYFVALVCHRAEKCSGTKRAGIRFPPREKITVADGAAACRRPSPGLAMARSTLDPARPR
jgi:hypothetical protein